MLLFILLLSCSGDQSAYKQSSAIPTRIVLLADTTALNPGWRSALKQQLPNPHRLIVSHTGKETPAEVQKRIPWLLQTGVDELYLLQEAWESTWLDSLSQRLPANTALRWLEIP